MEKYSKEWKLAQGKWIQKHMEDRINILTREIPMGGRNLTSTEQKRIRAAGYPCGRWFVVRAYASPNHGIVYKPCRTGGMDHAGIYVETI